MARTHMDVIELSDDDDDNECAATSYTVPGEAGAPTSAPLSALDLVDRSSSPAAAQTELAPPHIHIREEPQQQQQDQLQSLTATIKEEHHVLAAAAVKAEVETRTQELLVVPKAEPGAAAPVTAAAPPTANTVMIMGYSVDFPEGKRPFPAQLAVMNKVLMALKTGQHALLESPTGSGKTLALLCSSLTFQRHHVAELVQAQEQQRQLAAAALAVKKKHAEALNQQRAADEYARMNGSSSVAVAAGDTSHAGTVADATGVSSSSGDDDDDDFAASQPSFERFRFSAAATSSLTADGWISMASKRYPMRLDHEEDDEDFDTQDTQPDECVRAQQQWTGTTSVESSKRRHALPTSFAASTRNGGNGDDDNDDDDMESPPELKKLKSRRQLPQSFSTAAANTTDDKHESFHSTTADSSGGADNERVPNKRVVPPTIFFCSRTHSQLSQVVDELKNCPVSYLAPPDATNPFLNELRMCVLGSKAQYCVNRDVNRDVGQVDEACRTLMDSGGCSFANKRRKTNDLRRVVPPVWDIEDLVALAKHHHECGYFHARDVLEHAHIVFCPYNYILDPSIRDAVGLQLKNAIVVFDEAHNVEDTCRSSASLEVTADVLAVAIRAFTTVIKYGARPSNYLSLLKVLNGLQRWLAGATAALTPTGFEEESKVWTGTDALAMFAEYAGLTPETFPSIKRNLTAVEVIEKELSATGDQAAVAGDMDDKHDGVNPSMLLGALPLNTVRSVLHVADYMLREQCKYLDDFKLVVRKTRSNNTGAGGRFRGSYSADLKSDGWELKLCLWCLNAAVAFSDVAKLARSVILTSGTLSPMDSFAGELGTDFPIRLEANHVVNMHKQVFAGAIMRGPGGVDLSSTYRNQQEFQYQDSMGLLLLQYTQVVPGGILMFLPSYSLMSKLESRWRQTGLWAKIDAVKTMFSEPRKAGKDFDALLDNYKYAVAAGRARTAGAKTGAVFIAVYRGKVSEGIDFSNDNARAVLAVGIPFPSVKELQVALKREYQDAKSRVDKTLVNGHVWYNLQAFRALNQALGRCIRHRLDYGAILLLDSRHRGSVYVRSLSKWMRPFVREIESSEHVLQHFEQFFERNERELGTGAVAPPVAPLASRDDASCAVELKYETPHAGVATRSAHSAPPVGSLQSTMNSVKMYLEKKRLEDQAPRLFSLFQQGKPRVSGINSEGASSTGSDGSGRSEGSGSGAQRDTSATSRLS